MDVSHWRFPAQIVAVVDLVCSLLGFFLTTAVMIMAICSCSEGRTEVYHRYWSDKGYVREILRFEGSAFFAILRMGFTYIFLFVYGCGAIKLFKATILYRKNEQALELCQFWRAVSITSLLVVIVIFLYQIWSVVVLMITMAVRGIALLVVDRFMCELSLAALLSSCELECPVMKGLGEESAKRNTAKENVSGLNHVSQDL